MNKPRSKFDSALSGVISSAQGSSKDYLP